MLTFSSASRESLHDRRHLQASEIGWKFDFVLNQQSVLRSSPRGICVDMLNINATRGTEKESPLLTNIKQMEFSLSGKTMYIVSDDEIRRATVRAWDVANEKFIAKKNILQLRTTWHMKYVSVSYLAVVKEGVVLSPKDGTLELWNFELSKCFKRWSQLFKIKHIVSISAERVACVCQEKCTENTEVVIVLDTSKDKIMLKIQIGGSCFVSFNSKCQLLTYGQRALQLHDGSTTVWAVSLFPRLPVMSCSIPPGLFSPAQQFIVTWSRRAMLVLDTVSGQALHLLCKNDQVSDCKFVSDEECVVSSADCLGAYSLRLFNVKSGQLLSIINLERKVKSLAACPRTRLVAINQRYPEDTVGFKFIQVQLAQDKSSRKSKR